MRVEEVAGIPGAYITEPEVHADERGSFMEILREESMGAEFVQANHSRSKAGVLRGLHWHKKQSDAWYVIKGEAQAMLADIRDRQRGPVVVPVDLVADRPRVLYIPPGVAHGYLAVTDLELIYWVTHYYDGSDEFGVAWDDPELAAPWKMDQPVLSERDLNNPKLEWDQITASS